MTTLMHHAAPRSGHPTARPRHARAPLALRAAHATRHLGTTRSIRVLLLTAALLEASVAGGWMAALGVTGTGLVLAGNAVLLLVAGAVIR